MKKESQDTAIPRGALDVRETHSSSDKPARRLSGRRADRTEVKNAVHVEYGTIRTDMAEAGSISRYGRKRTNLLSNQHRKAKRLLRRAQKAFPSSRIDTGAEIARLLAVLEKDIFESCRIPEDMLGIPNSLDSVADGRLILENLEAYKKGDWR